MSNKLSNTKQEIKDIVFGYIRQRIATLLGDITIAKVVEYLCLKYYYVMRDEWDISCISGKMTLDGDALHAGVRQELNNAIGIPVPFTCRAIDLRRKNKTILETGTSSFLTEIIKSGTFEWDFRVDETKPEWQKTYNSTIGIWKVNGDIQPREIIDDNCFVQARTRKYAYGYAFGVGRLKNNGSDYKYGMCCVKGDKVKMILNMNQLELRFSVNDVDIGKAFDIEKGCYRAVVNMSRHGDSITLL